MSRAHRARRLALQGLCCLDAQGPKAIDAAVEFVEDARDDDGTIRAARKLLLNAWHDRDACDARLGPHARHWELPRLALVDRNILRLGVHELRTDRAPFKVIIAEGMKLAREFSTAESPRFVNGVLDAVARELGKH